MKKTLLTLALFAGLTSAAFAQGTVLFSNSSSSLVTYAEGPSSGSSVETGGVFSVALYWAVAGTADPSQFVQIGASAGIAPIPGRYSGGTRTTGDATAPSGDAAFLVRAWSTADGASYEEASQVVGAWVGSSDIFTSATGGGGTGPLPDPAVSLSTAVPGFGVTQVVPEPSVILLGIAGAGLLWFRRKK
jgi:hypothetical protein